MKLIIATGTRGNDVFFRLAEFMCEQVRRHNAEIIFGECSWSAIRAQQLIFAELAKRDYDFVLLVDSDVAPPMDALEKLIRLNLDIVGAPVWMADGYDLHMNIHRGGNYERIRVGKPVGVEEVSHVSFACILIHKNVFDKFRSIGESPIIASSLGGGNGDNVPDQIFTSKARAMGYKVHVCWDVKGAIHNRPFHLCDDAIRYAQRHVASQ